MSTIREVIDDNINWNQYKDTYVKNLNVVLINKISQYRNAINKLEDVSECNIVYENGIWSLSKKLYLASKLLRDLNIFYDIDFDLNKYKDLDIDFEKINCIKYGRPMPKEKEALDKQLNELHNNKNYPC